LAFGSGAGVINGALEPMKDDLALTGTGDGLITSTSLVGAAIGDEGWQTLLDNLSQICEVATQKGIRAVLHPHVGTMIENTAATAAGAGGLVDRDEPAIVTDQWMSAAGRPAVLDNGLKIREFSHDTFGERG